MATHKSEAVEPTDELGREWLDIEAKRNCRQKKLSFHLNQPSNGQKLCSKKNWWLQYQFKICSILSCGQAHHQPEYLRRGPGSLPCHVEGEQNKIHSSAMQHNILFSPRFGQAWNWMLWTSWRWTRWFSIFSKIIFWSFLVLDKQGIWYHEEVSRHKCRLGHDMSWRKVSGQHSLIWKWRASTNANWFYWLQGPKGEGRRT